MIKVHTQTITHSIVAVIALFILVANAIVVRSFDVFGSPVLFSTALLVELFALIILLYSLVRALKTPIHILITIGMSAWQGILGNEYVMRVRHTKSPIIRWFGTRLDPKQPTGLLLSVGLVLAFTFFIGFSNVLQDVWFKEPLTQIDTRVVNLVPTIRTTMQTQFFRFVTFTANVETILLLVGLTAGILWYKRQRVAAGLIVVVLLIEEVCALVLKDVVGRSRPEQSLSLIREDSFSFPSGHVLSAAVIFGFIAYLIYRSVKSSLLRLFIILGYTLAVAMVAISRIYLGVHYPSDVLASMLFGAAIVTLTITGIEIATRYRLWKLEPDSFNNHYIILVVPVILLFSLVAAPYFVHIGTVNTQQRYVTIASINDQTIKQLPLYSETLTGATMEPISFVYIGSQEQITQLFESHGWYKADPSTISHTTKALIVGFQGEQYLNAPVTPSYLAGKPETMAFQKPTQSNTLRQRHHTRLWKTNYKLSNGQEVWVATASFDEGIELAGPAKLPTHHIDPNIDAERSYIIASLGVTNLTSLQVVDPQAGKNASGDVFFTDGRAMVIRLGS
jgi:membrane-associated phospholipid phosphatase